MDEKPIRWYTRATESPAVLERLAQVEGYVHDRVDDIEARLAPHRAEYDRRLKRIEVENQSTRARIAALWQLADYMSGFTGDSVACRRGCSHCCHIAVSLPKQEAALIGERIGRKPARAAARTSSEDIDWGYHNPCPFLRDGDCSIYEHRPLACRVHFSVDRDDLLCRLDPPHTHMVPYLNLSRMTLLMVTIAARDGLHYADIREWFPVEAGK